MKGVFTQYHCNKYLGGIYTSSTSPNVQLYSSLKQMLICHHSSGIRFNFPHCYCFFVCVQYLSLIWPKTRPIRCLLNVTVRVDPFCVTCVISSAQKKAVNTCTTHPAQTVDDRQRHVKWAEPSRAGGKHKRTSMVHSKGVSTRKQRGSL